MNGHERIFSKPRYSTAIENQRKHRASLTKIDVTRSLSAIEQGKLRATDQLPPLVYEELRSTVAEKLRNSGPLASSTGKGTMAS